MNSKLTKATIVIICLVGCISCDPDRLMFAPIPTMEIYNPLHHSDIKLMCEEYKGNKLVRKTDAGAYFGFKNSIAELDSIPKLNFEEWFPKVMSGIDSIVIKSKFDNSIRKVWRKIDVFEEGERHLYNIKCWNFKFEGGTELDNFWMYTLTKEELE